MPRSRSRAFQVLPPLVVGALLLVSMLAGCGEEGSGRASGPLAGRYVGQEIWITYHDPAHQQYGRRTGRSRAEAKALAERLHDRVRRGEEIGPLARRYSNAPGSGADGFSGLLPADPANPSARDRALAAIGIGALTPVVEWLGGFWFARRIDIPTGAALERRMIELNQRRVKLRAIALLYRGAWIPDAEAREKVRLGKDEVFAAAETLLGRIRAGEDFGQLARQYSNDQESADRGGVVLIPGRDGQPTPWVHWGTPGLPEPVLRAAFERQTPGLVPEVIVSKQGIFLIEVLEIRHGDQ